MSEFLIRSYAEDDLDESLAMIRKTICVVNLGDYSKDQVEAWQKIDKLSWSENVATHQALVVVNKEDKIVGFGDMTQEGYLDHLFVDADFQGQGIASLLLQTLEANHAQQTLTTHASITARPFFEARGFHVVREQTVSLRGEKFVNYEMKKGED